MDKNTTDQIRAGMEKQFGGPGKVEERARAILAFLETNRGASAQQVAEALSLSSSEARDALTGLVDQRRVERFVGLVPENRGAETFHIPNT